MTKNNNLSSLPSKYPRIFEPNFSFECDDGWYWLIDQLCLRLQFETDKNGRNQVKAVQVKEKFAGLRFYVQIDGSSNEHLHAYIDLAESMSYSICEMCGSTQNVSTKGTTWIKSLCQNCYESL